MAKAQQDVIYNYDDHGRIIVDRYAKNLSIIDGDNEDCWTYEIHVVEGVSVHYANLIADRTLDVSGQQPVSELTQNEYYKVYLDLNLAEGSSGFNHPTKFEFTDQNMVTSQFPYQLKTGDNMVYVGRFLATPGSSPNVSAKMYDYSTIKKAGLTVRRMMINTS